MRLAGAIAAAVLVAALPAAADEHADFDFFVLALSWSPSYCAAEGDDANRMQCGDEGDYGFIVHGLWPQFESGYPEYCDSEQPARVASDLGERYFDIMPGMGLIGHQWRKHGTCTGLDHETYFETTRAAADAVAIPAPLANPAGGMTVDPEEVEEAFIAANAGLEADALAVTCDGERLREVRICLTKDLAFRACPEVDARGCRRGTIDMPPR